MKILAKSARFLLSGAVVFSALSIFAPTVAHASAYTAPSIPTIPVQIIADNNFAILLGDANGPTRVFYQNQVTWGAQIAAVSTVNVTPTAGESYIYVVAMGGNAPLDPWPGYFAPGNGGFEGWGGYIGGVDVTQYPGATLAVDPTDYSNTFVDRNPTCDPMNMDPSDQTNQQNCMYDIFGGQSTSVYRYLDISPSITGYRAHLSDCDTNADPQCSTVTDGPFVAPNLLQDVQRGLAAGLHGHPVSDMWVSAMSNSNMFQPMDYVPWADNGMMCFVSVCSTSDVGRAWVFPPGQAIVFRYPVSQQTPGIIPGNGEVLMHVHDVDQSATGLRVKYREHGTSGWLTQDFDLAQIDPNNLVVSGLINGTTYDFMLQATDGADQSPPTTFGADSVIVSAFLPDAPTINSATSGVNQISVDFTPPANPTNSGTLSYEYSTDYGVTWATLAKPASGDPLVLTHTSAAGGASPLVVGAAYPITIRAVLGSGISYPSNTAFQFATGNQTISWGLLNNKKITGGSYQLGTNNHDLLATASSNLTPTYSTQSTVCTVSSTGLITFLTLGTCTIDADQAGGNGYNAAIQVSQSFEIIPDVPSPVTITGVQSYATANSGPYGSITISFTEPTNLHSSTISQYVGTATAGSQVETATATAGQGNTDIYLTGLTVGTEYTISVSAENDAGNPVVTTWNTTVTPAHASEPVTNLVASSTSAGTMTISFVTPTGLNGSTDPDYAFRIVPHGSSFSGSPTGVFHGAGTQYPLATSFTFSGLANATSYDIRVEVISSGNGGSANLIAVTELDDQLTIMPPVQPSQPSVVPPMETGQSGLITSYSDKSGPVAGGNLLTVSGSFNEASCPIARIEVGGASVTSGSWKSTASTLSFVMPAHVAGSTSITIYNGCSPVLKSLSYEYVEAKAVVEAPVVTPTPKPTATTGPTPTPTPTSKPTSTPTPATVSTKATITKVKVYFDNNSAALTSSTIDALSAFAAKYVGAKAKLSISVIGYAQPTPGTEKSDQILSLKRAKAVATQLRAFGAIGKYSTNGAGRAKKNIPQSRYVEVIIEARS